VDEVGPDRRLRLRRDAVLWQETEGEIIALAVEAGEYVAPNESAQGLWLMLAEGTTRRRLGRALAERWGLHPAQAQRDADSFVAQLQERGLIDLGPDDRAR
jgi:hypothetical protein